MSKLIDLTGQKFGRLVVLKRVGNSKDKKLLWLCKCICGNTKIVAGGHLKDRAIKSCGCLSKEKVIARNISRTQHGHCAGKASKMYEVWHGMIGRCTNKDNKNYQSYGGRGIKVCKEWMTFTNFLRDMPGLKPGLQIDRINNNGNYCKSNCRWITPKQNNRNKRNNHIIIHNKKTQTLTEWAEEFQINRVTLLRRINLGWTIARALYTQVKKRKNRKEMK